MLAPGASQDVGISFTPCEARLYREVVSVNINGLYTMKAVILGEGSPLKLELDNPAHRSINLGAVSRGAQTSKTVQVSSAHCTVAYFYNVTCPAVHLMPHVSIQYCLPLTCTVGRSEQRAGAAEASASHHKPPALLHICNRFALSGTEATLKCTTENNPRCECERLPGCRCATGAR